MPYRSLDPAKILATATSLEARVAARFPGAGLHKVATEIVSLTRDTTRAAKALEAPLYWLRLLIAAVILGGGLTFLYIGTFLSFGSLSHEATGSVQGFEAAINTTVLAALGLTALIRLEARIKRQRVNGQLRSLRAVIHVIDMHQLTKDPAALHASYRKTDASPHRPLTAAELARYLDYCSELIAITGKLAALYAQSVNDEGVAQAAHDIENLGSNLSRKVWQKIMLIDAQTAAKAKSR
ncbi:MAG: hypothetical protein WCC57_13520 [Paracoccaceae bacterium]